MLRSSLLRVLSRASGQNASVTGSGYTARPQASNVACTILFEFNSLCVHERSVSDALDRLDRLDRSSFLLLFRSDFR